VYNRFFFELKTSQEKKNSKSECVIEKTVNSFIKISSLNKGLGNTTNDAEKEKLS
jgi:hypothetical protein